MSILCRVRAVLMCGAAAFCLLALEGCTKKPEVAGQETTAEERAAAEKLVPTKDPVEEEIYAFRGTVRQDYNSRRFAELEKRAIDLRREKAVFGNGSWKLNQFYEALLCRPEEPENMWQLHDQIHRQWIGAFPESMTARVAYAKFLVSYAWQARGGGYADTVTREGWRLFTDRVAAANETLDGARRLPDKDPIWWSVVLGIARAQGWSKYRFDQALETAKSLEPKYWGYDVSRAESLLPRWYGKPGDWEVYAEQAAARPDGLGDEVYARIVMALHGYYKNVFHETKASWPKTKIGLERMRQEYPQSLDILSETALLAVQADDRVLASNTFTQLGQRYLTSVWKKPEYFVRSRNWAATGETAGVRTNNNANSAIQPISPVNARSIASTNNGAPPAAGSKSWSAKTTRAIRVKADRREIVIPKHAQLRVIGRAGADVMVAYQGSTVTIPVSATDLR